MGRRTPLYELHRELNARMVDFAGWEMPLQYGSQIGEHHAVRRAAGVFDVSHMGILEVTGAGARDFLRRLLANDVARLQRPGQALYSCLLREDGGVLDDLIVYSRPGGDFRLVVNAANRAADLDWIRGHAAAGVAITERTDLAMIAVQGPEARPRMAQLMSPGLAAASLGLGRFEACEGEGWFVARTGYTGEDGFEVMLPGANAVRTWRALNEAGVASCGLGARDTLRLEAGLPLCGSDMDAQTNPLESALGWSVALDPADRDFIGRGALERLRASGGPARELTGLVLEDRGVLRRHQPVRFADGTSGEITSGSFSPTLERAIALARIARGASGAASVEIRGRALPVRRVRPPFVRHGRSCLAPPDPTP